MQLAKVLIIIVLLVLLWASWTYYYPTPSQKSTPGSPKKTEPFAPQCQQEYKFNDTWNKWGNVWNNDDIVPSFTNYDYSNYELPSSALTMLEKQYAKHLEANQEKASDTETTLPVPHQENASICTIQSSSPEITNQAGAPLHEVLEQDIRLLRPTLPDQAVAPIPNPTLERYSPIPQEEEESYLYTHRFTVTLTILIALLCIYFFFRKQ